MLYLLLAYLVISLICCWAGWLFYHALPSSFSHTRPLTLCFFTGLILLTGIGQWLSLFTPLTLTTLLLTLLGGTLLTLALLTKDRRRNIFVFSFSPPGSGTGKPFLFLFCCATLLLMILVLNAGPVMMDDSESYHIQMVKWIQEYGTVPGIANLHLRFGFHSSWFTAIAMLVPAAAGPGHYLMLNGLLSCWFCYYLLEKIFMAFPPSAPAPSAPSSAPETLSSAPSMFPTHLSTPSIPPALSSAPPAPPPFSSSSSGIPLSAGQNKSVPLLRSLGAACLLIIAFLSWPMIRGNATSANYDFISTCCILILVIESADPARPRYWPEWMIWPCFLVTVRISNGPLLLFSALAGIAWFRQYKRIPWTALAMAAFLILPFIARNIILSGYPLFPLARFDFFPVDWKTDKQEMTEILTYIKYYNRSNSHIELVKGTSFTRWLPVWYRLLFPYDKILVALSFVSWILLGLRWKSWTNRRPAGTKKSDSSGAPDSSSPPDSSGHPLVLVSLVITLGLSLLSWLLTAPDPRFIYGSLLAGPYLLLALWPRQGRTALSSPPSLSTLTGDASLRSPSPNTPSGRIPAARLISLFLLSFMTCIFVYTVRKVMIDPDYRNGLAPSALPTPSFRTVDVDGLELRIPGKVLDNWNPRCYDLPLPCLYRVNDRLQARGKLIRDGFRLSAPKPGPPDPVSPLANPSGGEYKID